MLTDEEQAELRELAEQLRQAERIRDLTVQGITGEMARQLPTTTGMAVHPDSIRHAAKAIAEAEAARDAAEADLAELGDETETDQLPPPPSPPPPPAPRPRRRFLWVFPRRAREHDVPQVEPPEAPPPVEESLGRRLELESARSMAIERLRYARRQWETLAGPDADPRDIDAVLRVHDPQFRLIGLAGDTSPTVRTANALYRKVLARWRVRWAALGYEEPPSPQDFEPELTKLKEASDVEPDEESA